MPVLDGDFKRAAIHKYPQEIPPLPPSNDPSPEMTYHLLAQELNKLSMKERDTILADIHGVAQQIEETAEFVQDSLVQLDTEVENIAQKSAYLQAKEESPEYVNDVFFRLKFLRAHRFEVKEAAVCLVAFFHAKLDLFGPQKLTKEILLEDLDEEDMDIMKRGCFQILPERDQSGRVVISHWPIVHNEKKFPVRVQLRNMFYVHWAAVESESAQKDGIVGVIYNVGNKPHIDRVALWQGSKLLLSLPVRLNSIHYCYDNPAVRSLISLGMVVVGEKIRSRTRSHFGSHIECIYTLLTFGIAEKNLPISACEASKLDLQSQWKWIEQRRKKETSSFEVKEIKPAGDNDVLFGRGKSFQNHPGNIWCRQLVESNLNRYETANKREKTSMANQILRSIQERSGRFLKFENNRWLEVEDSAARDKISHMFRSRRRKQPDADEEEEEEETPSYQLMVSDDLGAPENATRRTKKKSKKQSRGDKRPRYADSVFG